MGRACGTRGHQEEEEAMNHPEGTPEERRDCVRKLMIRGLTAKVMAELLKVSEHTIHADMRAIKERWIEEAAVVSDHALKAHEEIARTSPRS
jgi:DNA-directed RNA polymerase specialized sigma24 family protein